MAATCDIDPWSARPPQQRGREATSFVTLMYHNVVPDRQVYADLSPSVTSYFVTRSAFAEQLAEIPNCGGYCLSWEGLRSFYRSGQHEPCGGGRQHFPVLITFDDGWRDGVDIGGPLLEQHGHQALIFVTTDFIGRPHSLSRSGLSRLNRSVFRVGSHARSHRMLSLLTEAEIRSELVDSKKLLEDLVGEEIESLSIPSGAVDRRVRRIAQEAGYRFIFDSEVSINRRGGTPFAIGRVPVMRNTPLPAFRRYVRQQLRHEQLRRMLLRAPKQVLGLKRYEKLRRRLLGEKHWQSVTHES
jgi:peptidoglycan/xylan/chitin deacetylase (PgdA/CDA1 family)